MLSLIYNVLGELEIRHEGRVLELPSGHTLIVLAALLLNANRQISKADLLRAAWGGAYVDEAQLPKHIGSLRAILDEIGRRNDLITRHRYGYELRVPEDDLDMLVFERLVKQAAKAQFETRTDDEIRDLWRALRLWRAQHPLSNVPSEPFRQQIEGLEQRRKRAAVRLFDLELARGSYEHLMDDLTVLAGYHPTDRRLQEQLMIVLYRCGHATDANRVYERHVAALAQQTGGAPASTLRHLHYAIARGDETAIAAAEATISERVGSSGRTAMTLAVPVPRQLPPDPVDLVGRDNLVAEATWLLGREPDRVAPVVVISGPGGIGKTALAQRVAHLSTAHYPDGQLYVELRDTAGQPVDTGEVLAQFLRAFQVPNVPEAKAERISTYRTLLSDRRVLVVLDDAGNGTQIRDLIPANPDCGVLVTARQRMPEIPGAHHMAPLAPLDQDRATELFLRVVGNSGIDVRNELPAVEQVVALCGGLPLALHIAGTLRVHDHPRPTAELAHRLARQGPEAFAYGDLNVARTIGAGFDRLDEDARQLFLGLGLVQLPRAGLWTAVALRGNGSEASAALSELAASNMIDVLESEVRYRLHELTREYAYRRGLAEYVDEDDRRALRGHTYRALLTLTRRAHAALYGGDYEVVHSAEPDWDAPPEVLAEVDVSPLTWFEKERLNIRAAVNHCADLGLTDCCWDLAVSAHEFYTIGAYFDDWYATHAIALRACQDAGDLRGEGMVLTCLGQPALVASRRAGAVSGLTELQRAANLLAECGDRHGQGIALRTLANALRRRGQLARPLALFTEALGHYEASGDTVGRWLTLRFIGQTHLDLGSHNKALDVLRAAEGLAGELGQRRLLAQSKYWIGQACLAADDLPGARAAFTAMLDDYADPSGVGLGYAMQGLADVARRAGALDDAQRCLDTAATVANGGADALLEGRVHVSSAALFEARGRPEQQIAELELAAERFAEAGAAHLEAATLHALGTACADRDTAAARAAWARIEDLYEAMDVPEEDQILRGGSA